MHRGGAADVAPPSERRGHEAWTARHAPPLLKSIVALSDAASRQTRAGTPGQDQARSTEGQRSRRTRRRMSGWRGTTGCRPARAVSSPAAEDEAAHSLSVAGPDRHRCNSSGSSAPTLHSKPRNVRPIMGPTNSISVSVASRPSAMLIHSATLTRRASSGLVGSCSGSCVEPRASRGSVSSIADPPAATSTAATSNEGGAPSSASCRATA